MGYDIDEWSTENTRHNAVINHVMETKLYERFPIQEIFRNYVSVLMRGYCTDKGIAELIIAKQRSGPLGTVKLAWLSEFTTFANLAREQKSTRAQRLFSM